jgi:lipopolysaccharide export system permease protein
MKRVLGPYLRKRVAVSIIGLLAALTGLMQLLELLDVTTDVLNRDLGIAGIVHYAVLRLPGEMSVALPLAALLGSMSAFYAMARSREITALRAAGVGLRRILVFLVPVPIVLAIAQLALSQYLVPMSEQSLKSWWDSTIPLEERPAEARWVHTSNGVLKFDRNSADGQTLLDVGLYTRTPEGLLQLRTRARRADWAGNDWLLRGVTELAISGTAPPVDMERTRHWSSNLRPDDILQLDVVEPHMSGMVLADVIGGDRISTRPRSYYEAVLARSFTAPLAAFIMLLLALPSAIMSERRGGGGRLLVALALGLGFLLVDGILASFGTSGRIAPWLSASIAPLLFATIGFWQLFSCEHS